MLYLINGILFALKITLLPSTGIQAPRSSPLSTIHSFDYLSSKSERAIWTPDTSEANCENNATNNATNQKLHLRMDGNQNVGSFVVYNLFLLAEFASTVCCDMLYRWTWSTISTRWVWWKICPTHSIALEIRTVILLFFVVLLSFRSDLHDEFIHIPKDCFGDTGQSVPMK